MSSNYPKNKIVQKDLYSYENQPNNQSQTSYGLRIQNTIDTTTNNNLQNRRNQRLTHNLPRFTQNNDISSNMNNTLTKSPFVFEKNSINNISNTNQQYQHTSNRHIKFPKKEIENNPYLKQKKEIYGHDNSLQSQNRNFIYDKNVQISFLGINNGKNFQTIASSNLGNIEKESGMNNSQHSYSNGNIGNTVKDFMREISKNQQNFFSNLADTNDQIIMVMKKENSNTIRAMSKENSKIFKKMNSYMEYIMEFQFQENNRVLERFGNMLIQFLNDKSNTKANENP